MVASEFVKQGQTLSRITETIQQSGVMVPGGGYIPVYKGMDETTNLTFLPVGNLIEPLTPTLQKLS